MAARTLIASATNLLARGYLAVPTDRPSPSGAPVNALFAVARALGRALAFKLPERAVAVVGASPDAARWPAGLAQQAPALPEMLRALGLTVAEVEDEAGTVASYARAAQGAGDDVLLVGVDKRYAQLVGDRLAWYDANKDLRYSPEIVRKRFQVAPDKVAAWLALVGDDDQLPGISGVGAKGATTLVERYGSIEAALAELPTLEGRLGKALRAAGDEVARQLERARLEGGPALPVPLDQCAFTRPAPEDQNRVYEALGFVELLVAAGGPRACELCESAAELDVAMAALGPGVRTLQALFEDPSPLHAELYGVAVADAAGGALFVGKTSAAWPRLVAFLEDATIAKQAHDVVALRVAMARLGVELRGVVGDAGCASHLTEPSNWAPHELAVTAKHVLGRALAEDDAVRGVGRGRKSWAALGLARSAAIAAERAVASAAVWAALGPKLDPAQLSEYLALSDTLARMELTGLAVDTAELDRTEVAFDAMTAALEQTIAALAGKSFNINSTKQLGEVLFVQLGLPIVSRTKTGWSTATDALERIEHAHPIVSAVMSWRRLRRLRDSWIVALRRSIDADGRVHARFHPARSFSGVLIASQPDLGRVPGRTAEMARIRRAFVAPEGRLLMSVDFQQLGLYVLAHLTKDPALVGPLRERADLHRLTAAAVLELAPVEVSYEQRQLGKVVNFATFAGQGAGALALQLGLEPAEARAYLERFDRRYAAVRAFQDEQLRVATERGWVTTLAGRRWPIGGLAALDPMLRSYAERLARRATHEGSVADVSRRALLHADRALREAGLDAVPLLQIHDEVLFEVSATQLHETARVCADAMRGAFALEVPLVVGVEAGPNWADLSPVPLGI